MEKFICAVFDSPDMADLARARLAERGIACSSLSIEPTHRQERPTNLGVMVNPYNPVFSNNLSENWGSLAGANMGKFGGFAFVHEPIKEDLPIPSEVLMRIAVDEHDIDRAEDVLVGCHASSIRKA